MARPAQREPAQRQPAVDEDAPSLDPLAIDRAYRRERARRRARSERRTAARSSNARFWVVIAVLTLFTVLLALTAWHELQRTFGL
jgi:hypothetical protein